MDLADVDALLSPAGRRALDTATELIGRRQDPLATVEGLRKGGVDPGLASLVVTQARLRLRAVDKFGATASLLLFTDAGLEQATRRSVAEHRARRYAAVGTRTVADLCCGVGGDLMSLGRASMAVRGVEVDPVTAAIARANAAATGLGDVVDVRVGTAERFDLAGCDAAFVDPARRTTGGRRTFDPGAYEPPYSFVLALAARMPVTAAKVAPGIPHQLVPPGVEAEWVSDHGDVKEAALWFGPLAGVRGPARRRATLLPSGASVVDDPALGPPPVGTAGRWLHEPDGAAVRAGLVAEVAATLGGRLIDPSIAYVMTDEDVRSPFTHRYAVDAVLPFQLKRLRAALRERGAGDVVVKKRGSAIDPEELRRRLRLDGGGPTWTVLLSRIGADPVAILARPADSPATTSG